MRRRLAADSWPCVARQSFVSGIAHAPPLSVQPTLSSPSAPAALHQAVRVEQQRVAGANIVDGEALAQQGLLAGDPDRRGVDLVERVRDLSDLVPAFGLDRIADVAEMHDIGSFDFN